MPAPSSVVRWALGDREGFSERYARARQMQCEAIADEILEISDDGKRDTVTRTDRDGNEYVHVNHDHIARSRLRVESRKWLLSKIAPKKFGDKLDLDVGGSLEIKRIENVFVDPEN